jgi:hypothetical protein
MINTTTDSVRTRHLARPEDLRPAASTSGLHVGGRTYRITPHPGLSGRPVCGLGRTGRVMDQERLDFVRARWSNTPAKRIEDLPLCKWCAKAAGV